MVEEGDIDRATRLQRDWVFVECLDFNAAELEILLTSWRRAPNLRFFSTGCGSAW